MRKAKHLLLWALLILFIGCAVTILSYESGISFKGKDVERSGHGDLVTLDRNAGLTLRASCARVEQRAGMLSPVLPVPPVIPVSDDEPESLSDHKLYLIISANNWEEFNPAEFEIIINLEGREYPAELPESATQNPEVKFGSYYFATQLTCGQIKSSKLHIQYRDLIKRSYDIDFDEGYKIRVGYLAA